jgi:hypothetical protein
MIAYRAMLDVPRELAGEAAKLLRAERRARGTRTVAWPACAARKVIAAGQAA